MGSSVSRVERELEEEHDKLVRVDGNIFGWSCGYGVGPAPVSWCELVSACRGIIVIFSLPAAAGVSAAASKSSSESGHGASPRTADPRGRSTAGTSRKPAAAETSAEVLLLRASCRCGDLGPPPAETCAPAAAARTAAAISLEFANQFRTSAN